VPRCGSSLLCELLCNTGVAGAPTEFFDPELRRRFQERWGTSSRAEYLVRLLECKTSPNGVFGVKVHWAQLEGMLGDSDPAHVFPGLRYVYIRRADELRQAVSWVRALQTNQWASTHAALAEPRFDREQIDFYLNLIRAQNRSWEAFFARRAVSPHRVSYERLVQEPQETVAQTLAHLGEDTGAVATAAPLTLYQQADALTGEWVARYRAA
jgi:trehalose 2-sulfotransferase